MQSFSWRLPRGNGLVLPHHKERQYTIASALPKPCFFEDFYGPYAKASEKGPYFLTEYSTNQLFTQLTLLQQVCGSWDIRKGTQSSTFGPAAGVMVWAQGYSGAGLSRYFIEGKMDGQQKDLVARCTSSVFKAGRPSPAGFSSPATQGTQNTMHCAFTCQYVLMFLPSPGH